MSPYILDYINFASPYDIMPKNTECKPIEYYTDTPKNERKKVGTGIYRNGKEIMKTISNK